MTAWKTNVLGVAGLYFHRIEIDGLGVAQSASPATVVAVQESAIRHVEASKLAFGSAGNLCLKQGCRFDADRVSDLVSRLPALTMRH